MTTATMKNVKTNFVPTDVQYANLSRLSELMEARGITPAQGKNYSQSDIVKYALQHFFDGNTGGGRKATGTGDDIIKRIHSAVQNQIKVNKNTDLLVFVGRGRNKVEVKYEQRTITERFIREAANVNAVAVDDYLKGHGESVKSHNEWLVDNCGYNTGDNVEFAIKNFNRRTSKAEISAEKASNGVID